MVQCARDAARRLDRPFAGLAAQSSHARLAAVAFATAGRVPRGTLPARQRRCLSPIRPCASAHPHVPSLPPAGPTRTPCSDAFPPGNLLRLLDVNGSPQQVDSVHRPRFSLRAGTRLCRCALPSPVLFERVAVHRNLPVHAQALHMSQPCQPRTLVHQIVVVQISETKTLPPRRLVLAPMPIQELRQHPSRALFSRPHLHLRRDIRCQLRHPARPPAVAARPTPPTARRFPAPA